MRIKENILLMVS